MVKVGTVKVGAVKAAPFAQLLLQYYYKRQYTLT